MREHFVYLCCFLRCTQIFRLEITTYDLTAGGRYMPVLFIVRGVNSNIEIQYNSCPLLKLSSAAFRQPSGTVCSTIHKWGAHLGDNEGSFFCDIGSSLNNHILKQVTGVYSRVHIFHIPKRRIGYCNIKGAEAIKKSRV